MKNEEEEKKNTLSLKRSGTTIRKPKNFNLNTINGLRGGSKTALIDEKSRTCLSLTKVFQRIRLFDLLHITRPLAYVYLIYKLGRESKVPFLVSFVIELLSLVLISIKPKQRKERPQEKEERHARFYQLMKNLLREPVFTLLTLRVLEGKASSYMPRLFSLIKGILNYFRYYAFIA